MKGNIEMSHFNWWGLVYGPLPAIGIALGSRKSWVSTARPLISWWFLWHLHFWQRHHCRLTAENREKGKVQRFYVVQLTGSLQRRGLTFKRCWYFIFYSFTQTYLSAESLNRINFFDLLCICYLAMKEFYLSRVLNKYSEAHITLVTCIYRILFFKVPPDCSTHMLC